MASTDGRNNDSLLVEIYTQRDRIRELEVERDKLEAALREITRIAPLGEPTYPECYKRIQAIASAALTGQDQEGNCT